MRGFTTFRLWGIFCLISVLGLSPLRMAAQNFGEITGTVTDSTAAVITGASVSVLNTATNQVRSVRTNETGNYTVPFLVPGQYNVDVESVGFKKASRTGLILQVNDVTRVNFALEVGVVTEVVEVTGATPLLSTESTAVGTVIENKRIVDLPLNGRNYLQLLALSPNVTAEQGAGGFTESRQGGERAQQTFSIAGQRMQFNRFTLDGVENTDVNFNTFIIRPSIDALQEFKAQTGVYSAEFGRATSQINVTTKSGSNQFHGTLFEFLRNSKLDAKEWRQQGEKNPFRRNQFGFTFSGPIVRDRVFFLSNLEILRDRKTLQGTANVATGRMREGDFSATSRTIYDPASRVYGTDSRGNELALGAQPFENQLIPKSRFHPVALQLLEFYPTATRPGDDTFQNYVRQRPRPIDSEQFTQRIDFIESPSSNWFGRFSWGDEFTGRIASFPTQEGRLETTVYQAMLSNTRVFGPTVVNEFRFGYNQFQNDLLQHFGNVRDVGSELAIQGIPVLPPAAWGVPQIGMADGLSGFGEPDTGPYVNRNHSFQALDNISIIRGSHSLKFGAEIRRDRFNQVGNDIVRGAFSFNNLSTFDPTDRQSTGFSFAGYLLGESAQSQAALNLANLQLRATSVAFYAEDTWKITPRLTMNLGLRYENIPPYYDKHNQLVNAQMFDPGAGPGGGIIEGTRIPILTRPGSGDFYDGAIIHYPDVVPVQVGDNILCGRELVCRDNNDFAPRLGLAYSPNDRWTIRTGIGLFYTQDIGQARFDMGRNLLGRAFFQANQERPNSNLSAPWANDLPASGCSDWNGPCAAQSTQVQILNVNRRTPYVTQWMLNVQHQLTESAAIELGYMANQGHKLERIRSFNEPVARTGLDDGRSVVQRRPWPVYGRLHSLDGTVNSNYHGASVKLQQRLASGLTYLMGYTWSKAIDDGSAIRNQTGDVLLAINNYDFSIERGVSQFHSGHRLVTSVLYELPFGNRPGILGKILGGWEVSSIVTFSAGTPVTPSIGDTNGTAWGNRAHATGVSPILDNPTPNQFWNRDAFDWTNPDLFYKFGSAGRNSLIGPGFGQWDFSLLKTTRIREGHSLQFRFEAFNFSNHPNWNLPASNPSNATFGRIDDARTMREMQFGLKYVF